MDGDIMTGSVWRDVGMLDDVPRLGARVVTTASGDIAVFRTSDDRIFALYDSCPHKQGKLSQGIVHDEHVTCPLHNWIIRLTDGTAMQPDEGCTRVVPVRLDGVRILLSVPLVSVDGPSLDAPSGSVPSGPGPADNVTVGPEVSAAIGAPAPNAVMAGGGPPSTTSSPSVPKVVDGAPSRTMTRRGPSTAPADSIIPGQAPT